MKYLRLELSIILNIFTVAILAQDLKFIIPLSELLKFFSVCF